MGKTNQKFFSLTIALLTICFFIQSCSDLTDCGLTANREVKIVFGKRIGTSSFFGDSASIAKVYVTAIGTDSIFYDSLAASKISLSLSQLADSSIFILQTDSISKDTVTFKYHRELQMVSSECGFNTAYSSLTISKYTTNRIDTIIVLSKVVSSDVDKNFKLVMKPLKKHP